MTSRIDAVAEELGILVNPTYLDYGVSCVDTRRFVETFGALFAKLGKKYLDTCTPNMYTILLFFLCYKFPPRIAFIWIYDNKAEILVPPNKYYLLSLDNLSDVFGPKIDYREKNIESCLSGCYIPVSCEYLISIRRVAGTTPEFIVKGPKTFYVYKSSVNPISYNLLGLLLLWNGK